MLTIARAGAAAGCTEALFTLGDKPELRYRAAREALAALGHETTIQYLREMCALVLKETGLLPHVNPGIMTRDEIASLREVSASMGIMLESSSDRLCEPGGVHYGSPDKAPAVRLEMMRIAGELAVPFTTGILIGIGETRAERLESLVAIRDLHERYGHIQEVIVQNFRAKPNTKRATAPEPDLDDLLWSIAAARLILPDDVHVQAPPNLSPGVYEKLIDAGIDDWGGVSPVTPDHVNPEAPWPEIEALAQRTAEMGKVLVPRLPVYPSYAFEADRWCAPGIATRVRRAIDAEGWAREDDWAPGLTVLPKPRAPLLDRVDPMVTAAVAKAVSGARLDEPEIVRLFARARRRLRACHHRGRRVAPDGQRRDRALRRQPQHQLHQHLLLPLQVLRVLQGQDARGIARHAVRPGSRRSGATLTRGLGSRRHRSMPAGRHPSRLHRCHLCRHLPRDQGRAARHAHPCVLAAGGDARCRNARPVAARIPDATERRRTRHAARHRRGNPRRRGARRSSARTRSTRHSGSTW